MKREERIKAFAQLGNSIGDWDWQAIKQQAIQQNPWFTAESLDLSLLGLQQLLTEVDLETWTKDYRLDPQTPKMVGLVLAGNLPLVGFHDVLSVLIAGHYAAIKMSHQDRVLLPFVMEQLVKVEPRFERYFAFYNKLTEIDAVIATGSDNTSRYFEYYFGKYPNIIRRNRISVAVLSGSESSSELKNLGKDVFYYFGLGCRNVAKLLVPDTFEVERLLDNWNTFEPWGMHHKYRNNYDYYKSIFLVNGEAHLDSNFLLLRETEDLVSPTSVLYYHRYSKPDEAEAYLKQHETKVQCIVGQEKEVAFGEAQFPKVWDYADKIDVLQFLDNLSQ